MTPREFSLALICLACSACTEPDRDLPARYRAMAVPAERLASPDARARGRTLFLAHCALCHGATGDGRGERREGLARAPRDFTDALWRQSTSARRVDFAIREGVQGTPMPAWKTLDEGASWDLVAYVLSIGAS